MTIAESIDLMKREGDRLAKPVPVEGMPDMTFACSFAEAGANPSVIAGSVANCPTDLAEFWSIARTARLFEDQSYGQWGLEVLDPQTAVSTTRQFRERRIRDYVDGDLVIGKFLGDSDLLVIRCDPAADDFGNVLVALPIDPRSEWYCVANSLSSFLTSFIKTGGEKAWATP